MNIRKPIYTELIQCQDCYKCVRQCPVKAIQVVDDSAQVQAERCIYCGNCVNVCPVGAKKVRDDLGQAILLLKRKKRVIASIAPSFVSEFPGVDPDRIVRAIKNLGFWGVSETALGAEIVSHGCAKALDQSPESVLFSTACPTVVELIRKYHPEKMRNLLPMLSPLLSHCKMLRSQYGSDIGIVFFGPCISKKLESDAHPELLNAVLTFQDLHRWLDDMAIEIKGLEVGSEDVFIPQTAKNGALYPMDGGMNRSIGFYGDVQKNTLMAFSGVDHLQQAMEGVEQKGPDGKLFLEMLACDGGCVNGPAASKNCGTAMKWMQVLKYAQTTKSGEIPDLDIVLAQEAEPVVLGAHSQQDVKKALARLGKHQPEDELNCGGCGYDNCRSLAAALLDKRAEPNMCVSYMRKLAMNKANALIRSMPAGIVIVDEHLMVVECNRRFAETLGGELPTIYDAKPGMEGADIHKVAPDLKQHFVTCLGMEEGAFRKDVRAGDRLLRLTLFPVEAGHLVGAVVQDITEPAVQREQVISQAQEVIRRNVATVQKIAYLLGENAAETEIMLDSIASSFRLTPSPMGGPAPEGEPDGK